MLIAAYPSCAQGVVRGAVTTQQGQPLAGVELQVPALKKTVRSDSAGGYRLLLPPGTYRMTARALGYFTIGDTISPEANVDLIHDFALTALATILDTITAVVPRRDYYSPGLRDFDDRRRLGQGHYISEAQFRENGDRGLADVLRRMPGLLVRPGRGSAAFATSTRSAVGARSACYVSVYIDGMPLYTGLRGESPPDLSQFSANTMGGAEYYAPVATSPVKFKDRTGCGLLVLWSRER